MLPCSPVHETSGVQSLAPECEAQAWPICPWSWLPLLGMLGIVCFSATVWSGMVWTMWARDGGLQPLYGWASGPFILQLLLPGHPAKHELEGHHELREFGKFPAFLTASVSLRGQPRGMDCFLLL